MTFFNDNIIYKILDDFKKNKGPFEALSLNDNKLSKDYKAKVKTYFRRYWLLEI